MSIGVSLIVFAPGEVIKSSEMNNNFSNMNNASIFTVTLTGTANTCNISTNAPTIQIDPISGGTGLTTTAGGVSTVAQVKGLLDFNKLPYQSWSTFGGTGNGTYNHGYLTGVIPNMLCVSPISAAAQSWAATGGTTTQVTIAITGAVTFNATASFLQ